MKKILTLTIAITLGMLSYCQVTYREAPEANHPVPVYDSLKNMPQKGLRSMCGQEVLILGATDYYRKGDSFQTINKDEIVNKQYQVISVDKDEKNPRQVWMKLALNNDTVFYRITSSNLEKPLFLTIGFYEKQKQLYIGKKFKLKLMQDFKELNSGTIKEFTKEDNFVCTEITILKENDRLIPSFILKNDKGEEIGVPFTNFETNMSQSFSRFNVL